MVGLVIFAVILVLIVLLLITPIRLTIDTPTKDYSLCWGRILKAQVLLMPEDLQLRLNIGGIWKRDSSLASRILKRKERTKAKNKHTGKSGSGPGWRTVLGIIRSFTVRRWDVNVDTGDFATNAYLFPVTSMLNSWRGRWKINYEGAVEIRVLLENSPFRLLRAWIRAKR